MRNQALWGITWGLRRYQSGCLVFLGGTSSLEDQTAALRHEMIGLLPRMRRFARGLSGNAAEADDLVQETCEKALKNADRFQPGTSLESWMYRILQNSWRDRLKSAHRRLVDSVPPEELADMAGNAEAEAEGRLSLAAVFKAMAKLDENQRVVILLVCVEGQSYADAAKTLGWPVGTVMSRLARARLALHDLLEHRDNVVPLLHGNGR